MSTWPAATRAVGAGYFRAFGAARDNRHGSEERYWLVLPQWLNRRLRVHDARALNDILWAQYCLFAFVRLQDDVLDGQAEQSRLLFVAHEFLVEAERALARHVGDARVWTFYRAAIRQTARGILEADALQRRPRGGVERLIRSYARVSAILKVGAAAVCLPGGARTHLQRAERFADHLAIAGQLLDDLEDAADDLADGRLNAAARLLVSGAPPAGDDGPDRVLRALIQGGVGPVVARIRRHAARARAAIAPLRLPGAGRYLRRIEEELSRIERAVHHARVAAVFAAAGEGSYRRASARYTTADVAKPTNHA